MTHENDRGNTGERQYEIDAIADRESIDSALIRFGILPVPSEISRIAADQGNHPLYPMVTDNISFYGHRYVTDREDQKSLTLDGEKLDFEDLMSIAHHSDLLKTYIGNELEEGVEVSLSDTEKINQLKSERAALLATLQLHAGTIAKNLSPLITHEVIRSTVSNGGMAEKLRARMPSHQQSMVEKRIESKGIGKDEEYGNIGGSLAEFLLMETHVDEMREAANQADEYVRNLPKS